MTENEPILGIENKAFTRSVSVWVLRHFKPSRDYNEEKPLTDEAPLEAVETSEKILREIPDGEILIVYGAGPKGRHQETRRLLEDELEKRIKESDRDIQLVKLPSTSSLRRSLREAGFSREFQKEAGAGDVLPYWIQKGDEIKSPPASPREVERRFRTLLRGLLRYTGMQKPGSKINWLLVTSGEVPTPTMFKGIGKMGLGMRPGQWVKFDVKQGNSLNNVEMTYWRGQKATVNLSKVEREV